MLYGINGRGHQLRDVCLEDSRLVGVGSFSLASCSNSVECHCAAQRDDCFDGPSKDIPPFSFKPRHGYARPTPRNRNPQRPVPVTCTTNLVNATDSHNQAETLTMTIAPSIGPTSLGTSVCESTGVQRFLRCLSTSFFPKKMIVDLSFASARGRVKSYPYPRPVRLARFITTQNRTKEWPSVECLCASLPAEMRTN